MATFIAQQWQGSSKIITVKPPPVANEHKEIEHQAEMESGDEALFNGLWSNGLTVGWRLWAKDAVRVYG